MNLRLELALSALLAWCQRLLASGSLSASQEQQLQKLLRDIERVK